MLHRPTVVVFSLLFVVLSQTPDAQSFGSAGFAPTRLDTDPAISNEPALAARDRRVYVAWKDLRAGNGDIYFQRSLDAGATWLGEVPLESDPGSHAIEPVLAASSTTGIVFLAWQASTGGESHVYCRGSSNSGATWTPGILVDGGTSAARPRLVAHGQQALLVWMDQRDSGNPSRVYARPVSLLGSLLVPGLERRLDPSDSGSSEVPEVAASGARAHVVWIDEGEVLTQRSIDFGANWTDLRTLGEGYVPRLAVAGNSVHVAWYDAPRDIRYNRSTDAGATWLAGPAQLDGPGMSLYPDVVAEGAQVYVAWSDARASLGDIYVRQSLDSGTTWANEVRLDLPNLSPTGESYSVSLALHRGVASLAWEEGADGTRDIHCGLGFGSTWRSRRVDLRGPSMAIFSTGVRSVRTDSGTFLVWVEDRSSPDSAPRDIYFRRVF